MWIILRYPKNVSNFIEFVVDNKGKVYYYMNRYKHLFGTYERTITNIKENLLWQEKIN